MASDLVSQIPFGEWDPEIARVVVGHLTDPTASALTLVRRAGVGLEKVEEAYHRVRSEPAISTFVLSNFYHHRLVTLTARDTLVEWKSDPDRPRRIRSGEMVVSSTVEIHPSLGTCGYRCTMCLWSDRVERTYRTQGLTAEGLLNTEEWIRLLDELSGLGVTAIVVSGGGEALLNRELGMILARARKLGMRRHVYTTGFNLARADDDLWRELARCDQVRFSIHAASEPLYSHIVGMPARSQAFTKVAEHIHRLIALRDSMATSCRIGAGYVILPQNAGGLEDMMKWAVARALDFVAFRKDEVDVTEALSRGQLTTLAAQIDRIRTADAEGEHSDTTVDFSDELLALANGLPVRRNRTRECLAKYSRPTISPYGMVAPCDLKAEPRFADSSFNLGLIGQTRANDILAGMPRHFIPDSCAQCMPSSRASNAVQAKFLEDLSIGLPLSSQPFA